MTGILETMRVGIVGTGRGFCLRNGLEADGALKVVANCDIRPDQNEAVRARYGIRDTFTDYAEMLDRCDLDAVVVATPMIYHVEQAVMALDRGLHVISEVTAGMSVEECRRLVEACKRSAGTYCMAENGLYVRDNAIVRELVRQGLFGTPYFGEGEYLHHWKPPIKEVWRKAHMGVNGITYGTHPLGPLLSWMPGERVTAVSCVGAGRHQEDEHGRPYTQEDTCVMLCRLSGGGLLKIRVDLLSPRPMATINYMLQGTAGCYESDRLNKLGGRVWLASRSKDEQEWLPIESLAGEFLPEIFVRLAETMKRDRVHLGNDCITGAVCAEILAGHRENELDIHRAMDMTLPGLISQQSILAGGAWMEVPDSRDW